MIVRVLRDELTRVAWTGKMIRVLHLACGHKAARQFHVGFDAPKRVRCKLCPSPAAAATMPSMAGRPRSKKSKIPDTFVLRMPPEVRAELEAIAERDRRSLNGQIVFALESWLEAVRSQKPRDI